jgi:hypothetical protein
VQRQEAKMEYAWSQVAVVGELKCETNIVMIGSKSLTVGDIFVNSAKIVSRGTTCWLASALAQPEEGRAGSDLLVLDLVVKPVWRYSKRSKEELVLL